MANGNQRTISGRRWKMGAMALATLGAMAGGVGCSSGPQPPQPGTPAYNWGLARDSYRAGDLQKTSEILQRVATSDNEYTLRARVWDSIITAGMIQGYTEWADTWELGARANRSTPGPFRSQMTAARKVAAAAAIQFTEDIDKVLVLSKDGRIPLAFAFPNGSAAAPGGLKRVGSGILVPDAERELLQKAMVQRGMVLNTCAFVGNPGDAAAGQEKLKAGEFLEARNVFLMAAAKVLSDGSEMFTGTKLDQPNWLKLMSEEATKVLALLPESKDTKAISEKVQARLKKANIK